jgi:hypothetical protein
MVAAAAVVVVVVAVAVAVDSGSSSNKCILFSYFFCICPILWFYYIHIRRYTANVSVHIKDFDSSVVFVE